MWNYDDGIDEEVNFDERVGRGNDDGNLVTSLNAKMWCRYSSSIAPMPTVKRCPCGTRHPVSLKDLCFTKS